MAPPPFRQPSGTGPLRLTQDWAEWHRATGMALFGSTLEQTKGAGARLDWFPSPVEVVVRVWDVANPPCPGGDIPHIVAYSTIMQ